MGFISSFDGSMKGQGNSASGTAVSVTGMKPGDILVFGLCSTNASDVLTVAGLTNTPTYIDNNINLASIFSGVGAGTGTIGYVLITAADIAARTFTINSSKASTIGYAWVLLHPTAGVTPTVTANPPGTFLVAATSIACPQNAPTHPNDARVLVFFNTGNATASLYTVAEALSADNPSNSQVYSVIAGEGGTSSNDVTIMVDLGITSTLDTGTATLTESGASAPPKWYVRPFVISEGANDSLAAIGTVHGDVLEAAVPITAVLADHEVGSPDIIGRGGGAGISVY